MTDENIFSLTKIRMTPKTMKAFCVLSAALILVLLVVSAFVVPESSHSHGSHGSTDATDVTDDSDYAEAVDDPGNAVDGDLESDDTEEDVDAEQEPMDVDDPEGRQ